MTILQEPVKAAIWHSLNHYAYFDAMFLAERLYAEIGTSEALFLLATVYFRAGKAKVAQVLLEKCGYQSPECKLLYAQTAWELEQYAKIEQILTADSGINFSTKGISSLTGNSFMNCIIKEIQTEYGESACFALSLLGQVYLRTQRIERAELCFVASLKLNPFLWLPFESMCKAGIKVDVDSIFSVENLQTFSGCRSHFPTILGFQSPQQSSSTQRTKNVSKNLELENSAPDPGSILRSSKNIQNRSYLTEHQPTVPAPMSVAPSSVFSMKSGFPTPVAAKSQNPSAIKVPHSHIHGDHLVTPPPSRVDFAGIISTSGSLKPLPSSAISQKDTTIETAANEFLRSTPSGEHRSDWDSSNDSFSAIVNSAVRGPTKTQQRIGRGLIGGPATLSPLTPSFGLLPLADTPSPTVDRNVNMITPTDNLGVLPNDMLAPTKKIITRQSRIPGDPISNVGKISSQRLTLSNNTPNSQSSTPTNQQMAPVRRSNRIFANAGNSIKENTKNISRSKFNQPKAALKRNTRARHATTKSVRDLSEEISKVDTQSAEKPNHPLPVSHPGSQAQMLASQKTAVEGLMNLMKDLGHCYQSLYQYRCKDAIELLNQLPSHQRNTGRVLAALGRAHFELAQYKKAAGVFKELRLIAPHYLPGLEIYSTTLWHLQREVELSSLAHDMKELDKLCPETWCTVGNCFSLQQDHTTAASFFHRAIQLEPWSAYAYTLLGHELAVTDDLDGALTCYRNAVRCNPRHYNAWYGIGSIYYKQEKFKIAEIHFRKARTINSQNSVLLCHIGIVQHAMKQTSGALRTLNSAVEMDPSNPLCKFHRANVLFATEQYTEALSELLLLAEMVPKESLVHFLLGKVYKKLKKTHLAVISFSWAMDLDPKGANNQIKEAIDKQHLPDDDDISGDELTEEGSILETSLNESTRVISRRNQQNRYGIVEHDIRDDFQELRRHRDNVSPHPDSDESL